MRKTNTPIETLRGVAILLLVLFHAYLEQCRINKIPMEELQSGLLGEFCRNLLRLRMPLFAVISGCVYAMRPIGSLDSLGGFIWGKALRILVPLVVVATLLELRVTWIPLAQRFAKLPEALWLPTSHLWFLYAIFWVFLLVAICELVGLLRNRLGFCLVLAASFVVWPMFAWGGPDETQPPLGLRHALYLLPFFLVGLGFWRFLKDRISTHVWWLVPLGILCVGTDIVRDYRPDSIPWTYFKPILLLGSIGACAIALSIALVTGRTWRPLVLLGGLAFPIYLHHFFGISWANQLGGSAGMPDWANLLFAVVLGCLVPAALHLLLPTRPLRGLLLGDWKKPAPAWGWLRNRLSPPSPTN